MPMLHVCPHRAKPQQRQAVAKEGCVANALSRGLPATSLPRAGLTNIAAALNLKCMPGAGSPSHAPTRVGQLFNHTQKCGTRTPQGLTQWGWQTCVQAHTDMDNSCAPKSDQDVKWQCARQCRYHDPPLAPCIMHRVRVCHLCALPPIGQTHVAAMSKVFS